MKGCRSSLPEASPEGRRRPAEAAVPDALVIGAPGGKKSSPAPDSTTATRKIQRVRPSDTPRSLSVPLPPRTGASPVLVARDVELRRDGACVIQGLDWEVLPGQRWVILGPNGCGKTSLSLAIQGRLFPWGGGLEVLGTRFGRDPLFDLWARVGFAGEALDPLVEPRTTLLELVASAHSGCVGISYSRPSRSSMRRARAELDFWGIEKLKERSYHRVSLGQRRRCQIARALAPDPDLLVLDEPFAGLDPAAIEELLERLETLARERPELAILLVTHHIDEIPCGFDHALLLRAGQILSSGTMAATLTDSNISRLFDRPFRIHRICGRMFLLPGK